MIITPPADDQFNQERIGSSPEGHSEPHASKLEDLPTDPSKISSSSVHIHDEKKNHELKKKIDDGITDNKQLRDISQRQTRVVNLQRNENSYVSSCSEEESSASDEETNHRVDEIRAAAHCLSAEDHSPVTNNGDLSQNNDLITPCESRKHLLDEGELKKVIETSSCLTPKQQGRGIFSRDEFLENQEHDSQNLSEREEKLARKVESLETQLKGMNRTLNSVLGVLLQGQGIQGASSLQKTKGCNTSHLLDDQVTSKERSDTDIPNTYQTEEASSLLQDSTSPTMKLKNSNSAIAKVTANFSCADLSKYSASLDKSTNIKNSDDLSTSFTKSSAIEFRSYTPDYEEELKRRKARSRDPSFDFADINCQYGSRSGYNSSNASVCGTVGNVDGRKEIPGHTSIRDIQTSAVSSCAATVTDCGTIGNNSCNEQSSHHIDILQSETESLTRINSHNSIPTLTNERLPPRHPLHKKDASVALVQPEKALTPTKSNNKETVDDPQNGGHIMGNLSEKNVENTSDNLGTSKEISPPSCVDVSVLNEDKEKISKSVLKDSSTTRSLTIPSNISCRNYSGGSMPKTSESNLNELSYSKQIPKGGRVFAFFQNLNLDSQQQDGSATEDVDANMEEFLRIPSQLEALLLYGFAICLDSFLHMLTIVPLKFIWSCMCLVCTIIRPKKGIGQCSFHRRHMYQLIRVFVIYAVYKYCLFPISIGKLYHWIRGQAMLKLYVLMAMVEVFDRLMCSLGQDALDSLYWNTTRRPFHPRMVISTIVVFVYAAIHSFILFVHVATLNVAMNSADQALLTLLISGNFAEIKSTVFKKYNKQNLFKITTSDICERFKLVLFLALVLLLNCFQGGMKQEMVNHYLRMSGVILFAEIICDGIKHSFITKFNFIPSTVYPDYALILAGDITGVIHEGVNIDHTHAIVKRLGFAQIPLICVMCRYLREVFRYAGLLSDDDDPDHVLYSIAVIFTRGSWTLNVGVLSVVFVLLLIIKILLGSIIEKFSCYKINSPEEEKE